MKKSLDHNLETWGNYFKQGIYSLAGNYEEDVKTFLEARPDYVNEMIGNNMTVLMMACKEGREEFLKYLISTYSKFININQQNERGFTALYFAVWYSKADCARLLLSHPNIDVHGKCGELEKTVLWYCEDRSCFDLLLPYYPLMNEYEKKMAWMWSRYYHNDGGVDVKEMLMHIPVSVLRQMSNDLSGLLYLAAKRQDPKMVEYLLSSYEGIVDVNMQDKNGHTALREALFWKNADCIEILLDQPNLDLTLIDKKGNPVYDKKKLKDYKEVEHQLRINSRFKIASLLSRNRIVKWNRSKIMLVGQGRAGKTALANNLAGRWIGETESTIGADQMDVNLFYGGVKVDRLEEDERELESLIAELNYRERSQRHQGSKLSEVKATRNELPMAKTRNFLAPTNQSEDLKETSSRDIAVLPSVQRTEILKETTSLVSVPLDQVQLDEVELHYRKLQEMETASRYKLIFIDFGGQSIFNILHGFFMSRHGIYFVVFDMELFMSTDTARRECCCKELKFWLNSITMHTYDIKTDKTAPVAIVGTRGDKIWRIQDHLTISSQLAEMFGEMKVWQSLILFEKEGGQLYFFPNNNKLTRDNHVTRQLLRSIEQSLGAADSMNRKIPIFWIKIFDELRDLRRSYLSYDEVVRFVQQKLPIGQVEEGVVLEEGKIEVMEVRKMLRFFNDMGMLMWIEEKGLEDVIILDPIEYLVRPATIIICKHLATIDDPYRTKHEIASIHGESKKILTEDWMRMLEFGLLSEFLARDLLARFIADQDNCAGDFNNGHISLNQVLSFMIRFGLLVPFFASSTSSEKSENSNLYFVPSLLPADPSVLDETIKDRDLKRMFGRLRLRYEKMSAPVNIGMNYSLFCFLPLREGPSVRAKSGCDVFSSSELSQQGFLPQSLFERLICRYIQYIGGYDQIAAMDKGLSENELITGFKGKVEFTCQHHRIRLVEIREENRIEVIIQSHDPSRLSPTDREKEQDTFRDIYDLTVHVMELLLRECYEGLEVKTLIPLPERNDFITLKKVRSLLSSSSSSSTFEDSKDYHLTSYDAMCSVTLSSGEMRKSSYWSIWKEKVMISARPQQGTRKSSYKALIPTFFKKKKKSSVSGSISSSLISPLSKEGNKTHVFLSHDWGIDGCNHHRVKQVSEALKSRGLTTWIDDERIVTEIDKAIIDGINQTECMVVFVTENYVKKVNGTNDKDYCKREFEYGFQVFGRQKMIAVVLDEAMKDKKRWEGLISFNLGPTLYCDLSMIFGSPSNLSEARANEVINGLHDKIVKAIRST